MNPAEDYIINQPEPYRSILMHLQVLVEHVLPNADLKYKYKIPFYYFNGRPFCYFNASHKKKFVDVGFVKGKHIKSHQNYHISENRKMMISLRYHRLDEIDETIFLDVLNEAVSLY